MNSNKYTRGKARTREVAMQLQADLSESSISYAELAEIQDKLRKLGTQYGLISCLLYTSPSPRDRQKSRMPSSA